MTRRLPVLPLFTRNRTVACVVSLLAIGLPTVLLLRPRPASPRIVFVSTKQTTDYVLRGDRVTKSFRLHNNGLAPAALRPLAVGCDCDVTFRPGSQIPPGQVGHVDVTLDTTRVEGAVSRQVIIATNDPHLPEVALTVDATVVPEFVLSARYLDLGRLPANSRQRRELRIQARSSARVLTISCSDPQVVLEVQPSLPSADVRIQVTQRGGASLGPHLGNVIVATSSLRMPELRIPLRGSVVSSSAR
jgi:hypothetical protein